MIKTSRNLFCSDGWSLPLVPGTKLLVPCHFLHDKGTRSIFRWNNWSLALFLTQLLNPSEFPRWMRPCILMRWPLVGFWIIFWAGGRAPERPSHDAELGNFSLTPILQGGKRGWRWVNASRLLDEASIKTPQLWGSKSSGPLRPHFMHPFIWLFFCILHHTPHYRIKQ